MIRLTDPVSGMSESVFSNATGEYVLTTELSGELTVRLQTYPQRLNYDRRFESWV